MRRLCCGGAGSDQNSFYYDMNSTKNAPFSAKSGGPCCKSPGSCRGCASDCTMPAPYWKKISDFAKASGHNLMFGLVPQVAQAAALITHSASEGLPVLAYTFGNEIDSDAVTEGYPILRQLFSNRSIYLSLSRARALSRSRSLPLPLSDSL